jgi:hypothetical protein
MCDHVEDATVECKGLNSNHRRQSLCAMDTDINRKTSTTFTELKTLDTPKCLDSQAIQTAGPFHNVATYVGHGIFCRDIVSVTYVVAVGFCVDSRLAE